ncbi:BZ3500_MvSof-1268-A1-R1_Chr2-2g04749 [Microbotryum saponariae]|uniref:BZ3500_MvSof-1268-A1-R1_Chr2-2g04749 protein n=1 Tax=Microbotryum saponariae TaxID=289078 RepID=A0A2X0KWB0_9BASI|nr:BZ3500_MvSof-1268-A1-R1_Chr2-2g04749 [Microbotryum saponariae]SDA00067.1 BZ3501_MvSof-1269-A2-R1_Chr2-2g04423 [Microbotryum saponariae]
MLTTSPSLTSHLSPSYNEPFIQLALLTVKEGQGDLAQPLLSKVRQCAESDQEPGCLTFRTSRGSKEEGKGDEFVVYEEYASREALTVHRGLEFSTKNHIVYLAPFHTSRFLK